MLNAARSVVDRFWTDLFAGDTETRAFSEPAIGRSVYVASGVINLLALALPLTILQVYDRVLPNSAFDTLTALVVVLLGVITIDAALKYLRSYVVNWSASAFTHKLSARSLATMLKSPPSRFNRTTVSEHLERLNAVSGLGGYFGGQSRIVAVDILFIPIFASVIILVGGMVFFVVLSLFAVFGYLAVKRANTLNNIIAEREKHDARKYDFVIEALSAMPTIKAQAMEPLIMRRFERLQSTASVITRRVISLTGTAQTYNALYASLSIVAIVGVGAILVFDNRLSLGALACCMLLSSQLLQPLMRSLSAWNEIQLAKHQRGRVSAIFEDGADPDETQASTHDYYQEPQPKSVIFEDVSIQYPGFDPLFTDVNVRIPAGALVAIRGADGSGRTSLLRSLLRDVPVSKGKIRIGDDIIVGGDGVEGAAACVRYVGPTPTIFRGAVLDNLTLFGEVPAKSALWASRLIGLENDIVRMPLGYDTFFRNSAGRDIPAATAQRICIARALAMRPSVLILDDANTLLDFAGEKSLSEALKILRGKITILFATHRPSLVRLADAVYDIRDRRLVAVDMAATNKQAAVR